KVANFLAAGSLIALVTAVAANLLTYLPMISSGIKITSITQVGVLLEILVFNSGLAYKARQEEIEKLKTAEKLVKETTEKARIEKEFHLERKRISADLHDDVGATLSSISIFSEAATQKLKKANMDDAKELLE